MAIADFSSLMLPIIKLAAAGHEHTAHPTRQTAQSTQHNERDESKALKL